MLMKLIEKFKIRNPSEPSIVYVYNEYYTIQSFLNIVIRITILGFFLNWAEFSEFRESAEAWITINLTVFSARRVCGTVVESLALTREKKGFEPSNLFKIILFLSLNSGNSVKTFRENSNIITGLYMFTCGLQSINKYSVKSSSCKKKPA